MKDLMKKIMNSKDDVVFVGSLVLSVNGKLDRTPKDIDIVVTSLDGLQLIGDIKCYESNSVFAKGSKRCCIDQDGVMIDIWLKDELPEWEIIDGFKYQTIDSQIKCYQDVKESTDDEYIKKYIDKWQTHQGLHCQE